MKRFPQLATTYIIWVVIMLALPMILIVFYSITEDGNGILDVSFTLEEYKRFFTDPDFLLVLWRSIKIAVKTTIICVIIGYPVAYAISKTGDKTRNILVLMVTLPMLINMLVRTYAWIGLLSDGGILQRALEFMGLGTHKLLYTEGAVIIGMVYNFMPFMVIQINAVLSKMDKSLIEASADLGASKVQTFKKVIFPLSLPGVVSGISLVFLPCVSSFFIPKLLGGGQFFLIGNVIENQFITAGEWAFGSAISVIMAFIMMASMYVVRAFEGNKKVNRKEREKG